METLSHLPEWCVYIETPGMTWLEEGVRVEQQSLWASLGWAERERTPLALAYAVHTAPRIRFGHVPLAGTLEQSLIELDVANNGGTVPGPVAGVLPTPDVREKARKAAPLLSPLVSLVLYLCSEAAEMGDGTRTPQKPQPRRTKGQERMFPAPAPVSWSVSVRMGAALRRAQEQEAALAVHEEAGGRRNVRPHVRRAHWAHRWTGPMGGERKTVLRWLHPALVNAGSPEELPSVIRRVASPTEDP